MANNFERQVMTLANFGVDQLLDAGVEGGIAVGDHALQFAIPKGKVVTGVILRNMKDDLASSGAATVAVKLGATTVAAATAISSIKGTSLYFPYMQTDEPAGLVMTDDTPITVTVAVAPLTAGNLDVVVLYI